MLGAATVAVLLAVAASAQADRFAYVANSGGSDNVSQYGIGAGGLLAPLSPPTVTAESAHAVAVSSDGESVYVVGGFISQFDIGPGGVLSPKSPPTVAAQGTNGLAVSPDVQSVYIAITTNDTVAQYDVGPGETLSPKTPASVSTGKDPSRVAVSPDGQNVYVTNVAPVSDSNLNGTVSQCAGVWPPVTTSGSPKAG